MTTYEVRVGTIDNYSHNIAVQPPLDNEIALEINRELAVYESAACRIYSVARDRHSLAHYTDIRISSKTVGSSYSYKEITSKVIEILERDGSTVNYNPEQLIQIGKDALLLFD